MRKILFLLITMIMVGAIVLPRNVQADQSAVLQVNLATTEFANGSGLGTVTGRAYLQSDSAYLYIELESNGAQLPAGSVLEGWLVDAGLEGGPGISNASDFDQGFGIPSGNEAFYQLTSAAPYALSSGILQVAADGRWIVGYHLPNTNFSPYDAVVVTLESDGNVAPWDPRPGTPVFSGLIAEGIDAQGIDIVGLVDSQIVPETTTGIQVPLVVTPLAANAGVPNVSGTALLYNEAGVAEFTINLNGAVLPQGAVLEAWVLDLGRLIGGVSNASNADEVYGVPFGNETFHNYVEDAPYALSLGVLSDDGTGNYSVRTHLSGYNFAPYDFVAVSLETDGNSIDGYDPRLGSPILLSSVDSGVVVEPEGASNRPAWQEHQLTNVRTGEVFTIADLTRSGKTVLVEPMATWCPNCAQQQGFVRQAQTLLNSDDVVFISLSVETNISADDLANYSIHREFDWVFVLADTTLLDLLTTEFGRTITSPPSTPHFVVYPDGSYAGLFTGYTMPDEIINLVNGGA